MNRRSLMTWGIPLVLLLGVGCAGDGSGIPSPVDPGCNGLEPRLECIQEMVFTPTCAVSNCHDLSTASVGLVLEAGLSHGRLVGVTATEAPGLNRVEPGNPDDSYLIIKLEGTDPRLQAAPMPLGQSSLSTAEIQAIRQWIADGAQDN